MKHWVGAVVGLILAGLTAAPAAAAPDPVSELTALARGATPSEPTLLGPRAGLLVGGVGRLALALPAHAPAVLALLGRSDGVIVTLPAAFSEEGTTASGLSVRATPDGSGVALIEADDSTRLQLLASTSHVVTLTAHGPAVPAGLGRAVVFRAPDGAVVGGLAPPTAIDSAGVATTARYEVEGQRVAVVLDATPETVFPVAVEAYLGGDLIEDYTWETPTRVLVTPARWARELAPADPIGAPALGATMLAELRALQPEAEAGLLGESAANQLSCHMVGARDKPSWNLETDRQDKGFLGFLASSCN